MLLQSRHKNIRIESGQNNLQFKFKSFVSKCHRSHLFYAEMQGTCHGDIEAIDVIHRQHCDGHLLSGPGRGEDELRVIGAESVTARHQVVLGQGDSLNTWIRS